MTIKQTKHDRLGLGLGASAPPHEAGTRRTPQQARLAAIGAALNDRQRTYLLVAYEEDQRQEERHRGFGAAPARTWRWMEYGPDRAILCKRPANPTLSP